jgi:hypothetical protein
VNVSGRQQGVTKMKQQVGIPRNEFRCDPIRRQRFVLFAIFLQHMPKLNPYRPVVGC